MALRGPASLHSAGPLLCAHRPMLPTQEEQEAPQHEYRYEGGGKQWWTETEKDSESERRRDGQRQRDRVTDRQTEKYRERD